MKPYDQINWKSVIRWSTFIFLPIVLAGFLLIKPIMYFEQELGYAFANPTLWLLDLEHLMWEQPITTNHRGNEHISGAGFICCGLSSVAHIVALSFSIAGLCSLYDRAKRRW